MVRTQIPTFHLRQKNRRRRMILSGLQFQYSGSARLAKSKPRQLSLIESEQVEQDSAVASDLASWMHSAGLRFNFAPSCNHKCFGVAQVRLQRADVPVREAIDLAIQSLTCKTSCLRSWEVFISRGVPNLWHGQNIILPSIAVVPVFGEAHEESRRVAQARRPA